MRIITGAALAALAIATLGAVSVSAVPMQQSVTKKKAPAKAKPKPKKVDPVLENMRAWDSMSYGGPSGDLGGSRPTRRTAPVPAPPAASPAFTLRDWMVGSWAEAGRNCAKSGLMFNANGSYQEGQLDLGRWSVSGSTLTLIADQQIGDDGQLFDIPRKIPKTFTVAATGTNQMSFARAGNTPSTLIRCGASRAAAPAPRQQSAWAGSYRAFFDGADGSIAIKGPNRAGYQYEVTMRMANGQCRGEAYGGGKVVGNTLTVIVPAGSTASGWKECRIKLSRGGIGLTIAEGDGCGELHGSSCGFSGSARAM